MRIPALLLALVVPATAGDLLVTSRFTDQVLRYDEATGAFIGVFASGGGLVNPVGVSYGPDGALYVASANTDQVLRYDGLSGTFLGVFAQDPALVSPRQIQFGPSGDLFVASAGTDEILRFDGANGAFLGVFSAASDLDGPNGITFGTDGHLYVAAVLNNRVKVYDGSSGAALGDFVSSNLSIPHDVSFGPDGHLYVTNASSPRISRHDGQSGLYIDDFVNDPQLSAALGMLWLPNGDLLVVNQGADDVRRYDGVSGALTSVFVLSGAGGVDSPLYATSMPETLPTIELSPAIGGLINHVVVRGVAPGAHVRVLAGTLPGSRQLPCGAVALGIGNARLVRMGHSDESGRLILRRALPPRAAGLNVLLQAADAVRCTLTPVSQVTIQ